MTAEIIIVLTQQRTFVNATKDFDRLQRQHVKVSKSRKQILKFSFEPKK